MNPFLLYLLKSTLLLAVFDAFFLVVMRHSGHFRFNRATLLAGSAVCLLLPLLHVRVDVPTVYSEWLVPVIVSAEETAEAGEMLPAGAAVPSMQTVVLVLYGLGACITLGFYVRSYAGMFRMLRRSAGKQGDGYILHLVDQDTPSFSWMQHIVLSRTDFERYPAILAHERAHVRCGHSRDLLLSSALTAFQWFNPLVWICRTELKLLHEYEADDCVIKEGIDAMQYQLLLVKKAVGEKRFLLANGFNHAQLKNRIAMMQASHKAAWKKLSLLLALPLLAGVTLMLAERRARVEEPVPITGIAIILPAAEESVPEAPATAEATGTFTPDKEEEPIPFILVEKKPRFQGGNANSFSRWVNQHLQYPAEAKDHQIQGRVTLQFTVETDGSVANIKVLRSPDPLLSEAAVKAISESPKWEPGTQRGNPTRVIYNFPVVFQLQ
jgi:TonB family protein